MYAGCDGPKNRVRGIGSRSLYSTDFRLLPDAQPADVLTKARVRGN